MKSRKTMACLLTISVCFGMLSFSPQELVAQDEGCPDCLDDTQASKHKMTLFDVAFGWYPEPSPWHLDYRAGFCMFHHTSGCWDMEDEQSPFELVARLQVLEGEDLADFVNANRDRLELDESDAFIGVLNCTGSVAFWVSLEEDQIQNTRGRLWERPVS